MSPSEIKSYDQSADITAGYICEKSFSIVPLLNRDMSNSAYTAYQYLSYRYIMSFVARNKF